MVILCVQKHFLQQFKSKHEKSTTSPKSNSEVLDFCAKAVLTPIYLKEKVCLWKQQQASYSTNCCSRFFCSLVPMMASEWQLLLDLMLRQLNGTSCADYQVGAESSLTITVVLWIITWTWFLYFWIFHLRAWGAEKKNKVNKPPVSLGYWPLLVADQLARGPEMWCDINDDCATRISWNKIWLFA